jgi:8-oxo-dGTP diphosphatase
MISEQEARAFLEQGYRAYLPHHVVDCVIFGFHAGALKILLLQWKHLGRWSLPGGPIRLDESIDAAASRVLEARTGLADLFLRQFHTFGGARRGEAALRPVMDAMGIRAGADFWLTGRVVSTGYYALVDFSQAVPAPDFFSEACRWWDVDERPPLLFDHDEMVAAALRTLRSQLDHGRVGGNLLPETFTMSELQRLHEAVLGRRLDRRNFQKRMLELGVVERLPERKFGGAHRAPYLYRFAEPRAEGAPGAAAAAG